MPYSYPFTHNLRTETEFRTNIGTYASTMLTNYSAYARGNQTERNKFTELLSSMHLKDHYNQPTQLCKEAAIGNIDLVLFNFIEKFQYPNFCSSLGYDATISNIKLTPMRAILKLLYIKHLSTSNTTPYLTENEISNFIFSNPDVYLNLDFDCLEFWNDVVEYRNTTLLPPKINNSINIERRKLRAMLNIMGYTGLVQYSNQQINLDFNNLSLELQKQLLKINMNTDFMNIIDNLPTTKTSYFNYFDVPGPDSVLVPNMDLTNILAWFNANPSQVYSDDIIANFHINLNCLPDKHFIIVSGVSGTGKTNLIKQYTNAVYNTGGDNNPYFKLISVRPDWEDEKALFGYYNALEKKYEVPEFLKTLLLAKANPSKNYFICLDEMNLAHVEYYFSDYLSAVESKEPISLNNFYIDELLIPSNVFIIGTINEDETTERISDKVWDRAFKVEMNNVDIGKFLTEYCNENSKDSRIVTDLDLLVSINEELKKVNMHFGYRFVKEIVEKLDYNYQALNGHFPIFKLIDNVLLEKMFPKIKIELVTLEVLNNLKSIIPSSSYPDTNNKLDEMILTLESNNAVW